MKRPQPSSGFTLIEVMVVVALVGLLTAVVLLTFRSVRDHGRRQATGELLMTLDTALQAYHEAQGAYPDPNGVDAALAAVASSGERLWWLLERQPAARTVLERVPASLTRDRSVTVEAQSRVLRSAVDAWGRPLAWEPNEAYPVLRSAGPDGRFEAGPGSDDLTNLEGLR